MRNRDFDFDTMSGVDIREEIIAPIVSHQAIHILGQEESRKGSGSPRQTRLYL